MKHAQFGYCNYECDKCHKDLEHAEIALRMTDGKEETRLLGKSHYCGTCAPVVRRTFLLKEEHA